jgi:hypothetical protein
MYAEMKLGKFGNHTPFWTPEEAKELTDEERERWHPFSIRWLVPSANTVYNRGLHEVLRILSETSTPGLVCAMAPNGKEILQGEVTRTELGLVLFYGTRPGVMKQNMPDFIHAYRLTAKMILQHFMDEPSYNNLMRLLDEYPDHVIEFSTFSVRCGSLNWNTLFWEVRQY